MRHYDILLIVLLSMIPGIESRGAFLYYARLKIQYMNLNDPLIFLLILFASYAPSLVLLNLREIERIVINRSTLLKKLYDKTLLRIRTKTEKISRYKSTYVGLAIFVAFPVPGTGVWTGSLLAYVLGLNKIRSYVSIFIGNTIACTILYLMVLTLSRIV